MEGRLSTTALDSVELLSLNGEVWCQLQLPPALVRLEGSTMDWLSMFDFMEMMVGNVNYTSPHSSMVFERILLCGGIDQEERTQTIKLL